jgi:hypothetical protein
MCDFLPHGYGRIARHRRDVENKEQRGLAANPEAFSERKENIGIKRLARCLA